MPTLTRALPPILLLAILWIPPAHGAPASPDSDRSKWARYHYGLGKQHYKKKEYRKALEQFRKVLQYRRHANVHLSLGMCYRKLKKWSQALLSFKRYLSLAPRASNRRTVAGYVRSIQKKLRAKVRKRGKMGRLSVITTPPGAAVYVDTFSGRPRGLTPAILRVKAGAHIVEIRRTGYRNTYRKAVVKAGDVTLLQVVLVPAKPARPITPPVGQRPRPADTWVPGPLSDPPTTPTRPAPPPPPARSQPPSAPPPAAGHASHSGGPPSPGPGVDYSKPLRKPFWSSWWFWTGATLTTMFFVIGKLLDDKAKKDGPEDSEYKSTKQGSLISYVCGGLLLGGVVISAVVNGVMYYKDKQKRKQRRHSTTPRFSCGLGACSLSLRF